MDRVNLTKLVIIRSATVNPYMKFNINVKIDVCFKCDVFITEPVFTGYQKSYQHHNLPTEFINLRMRS